MGWLWFAGYLVISGLTYIGLLRVASREFGVDWFYICWSLSAFIPFVGPAVLLILWVSTLDWDYYLPEIPRWLRRLAGDE